MLNCIYLLKRKVKLCWCWCVAVMVVLVGLSVRHGGGTGVVTLSILLSPHPLTPRPTPGHTQRGTETLRDTPGHNRHREIRRCNVVMITGVPSDYAVMVAYKIIQAGPPLVITYLLSLNSRGFWGPGTSLTLLPPSLPPCLPASPDNL